MVAAGYLAPFSTSAFALFLLATAAAAQESVLSPVSVSAPSSSIFPEAGLDPVRQYGPRFYTYSGPKQTNKFWANWAVDDQDTYAPGPYSIYPMPYALRWISGGPVSTSWVAELAVSHNPEEEVIEYDNGISGPDNIQKYYTPVVREFSLGAVEQLDEFHEINKETLFGVHIAVNGPAGEATRKITYPIFQGMVYVSGRYEGDITPKVSADAMVEVTKVSNGIWKFVNDRGTEFRVYALTPAGEVVDDSYAFSSSGVMNQILDGWLRVARVVSEADAAILDAHAGAILWGWEMDIKEGGIVEYTFEAQPGAADASKLIHFAYAHHLPLITNAQAGLSPMKAPTKGNMIAVEGLVWSMNVGIAEQEALPWLPAGSAIPSESAATILAAARDDLAYWESQLSNGRLGWQADLLLNTFYWAGKGFQKLGTVCLMLEELAGADDDGTVRCTDILAQAFQCFYDVGADPTLCAGKPNGAYYDLAWGGIPSRDGFYPPGDGEWPCYAYDFGNACYNDHHYHYGYFVVSAAILVKLRPALADDALFVDWVQTLIRDTANPSAEDTFFPPFRCFDFFDFHSWSRGNMPSYDGKDQESTSEEINLLYGLILWGRVMEVPSIQSIGATMLALESVAIKDYFLMKTGNPNHLPDFAKNHVTGIFFQNLVRYDTWFGTYKEYIHGIQMLPLSPALQMTRDLEFCQQEWDDVLSALPYDAEDPWSSLITAGSLSVVQPDLAWERFVAGPVLDSGLTKSFALYWTARYAGTATTSVTTMSASTLILLVGGFLGCVAVSSFVLDSSRQMQGAGRQGVQLETVMVSS